MDKMVRASRDLDMSSMCIHQTTEQLQLFRSGGETSAHSLNFINTYSFRATL